MLRLDLLVLLAGNLVYCSKAPVNEPRQLVVATMSSHVCGPLLTDPSLGRISAACRAVPGS